ncbi:MAG: 6,7-dimethyl-8-ribityllumazine synthase [Flavobacteriales bacterium]|nr:6,7-dimethyl-8-ribityllumazine synthase [Flavobacteriales bacterium]
MATANKNLSNLELVPLSEPSKIKIGVVVSEWNETITNNLLQGAVSALRENKIVEKNIIVHRVPGTFELPLGAQYLLENNLVHGVITIGCVIQGETKHFDFVCQGATQGIVQVGLRYNKPVSFCVLTDENEQQSIDRSGGKYGNKGIECAISCLKMIQLKEEIKKPSTNIGF